MFMTPHSDRQSTDYADRQVRAAGWARLNAATLRHRAAQFGAVTPWAAMCALADECERPAGCTWDDMASAIGEVLP